MNTIVSDVFSQGKSDQSLMASIPPTNRIYCIGDIHGRSDLLLDLAGIIVQDAAGYAGKKTVVFLGDYIDRGMYSKQVIDIFLDKTFLIGFEKVFLKGNHEQTLLKFVNEDSSVLKDWWQYGAQATFHSYGVKYVGIPSRFKFSSLQKELKESIPDCHLEFYKNLKESFIFGDYFFVHAGIKPGLPLEFQSYKELYWIRDEFLNSTLVHEKVIVHGHTIVDEPEILINRIGIDTGAYATGKLSCLVLEGHSRRILNNYSVVDFEKPSLDMINTVSVEHGTNHSSIDLSHQLNNLITKLAGFEAALLISGEGGVVASTLPNHLNKFEIENKSVALLEVVNQTFDLFKYGKLNELIMQGAQGYTVMVNTGFGLTLIVAANRKASLGQIMLDMRSLIEELSKTLMLDGS